MKFLFVVAALTLLSGCTLQYPIVGMSKNYNEVFKGTVTGNILTGHHYTEVQGLVSKIKCAGTGKVTHVPATGGVAGQRGESILNCEDGRAVQATYTITGHAAGFGVGRDQYGNEYTFSFGMSDSEAAQKVADYLRIASERPDLPTSRSQETSRQERVTKREESPGGQNH